jgi:ferritin-like metal-binding protein YciE
MKINSPCEPLSDQIRDLHSVEILVASTMPDLAAQAHDPELRAFLPKQEELALAQKDRLRQAAEALLTDPDGDVCKAMQGLIDGGDKHVAMAEGSLVTNLILTAHVSRIFHYQIAGYEFAHQLARYLDIASVESLSSASTRKERETANALGTLSARFFREAQTGEER